MAQAVLNEIAIENYTRYWRLPRHHVSFTMVQGSSAGVTGWADLTPGDADVYGDPGHFPQTKSRRETEEYRRLKKANKVDRPVWKTADYSMTEAGQLELGEIIKKGTIRSPARHLRSTCLSTHRRTCRALR